MYLGFARKYATPRTEHSSPDQPPPDYVKALEFFQQAIELGPKPELRPEIEMQIAECHRLSGNFEEAANRYAKFIKERADDPRTPEARYRLGESRFHQGRHAEARRAWQDLMALWPGERLPADKTQADFVARSYLGVAWSYRMPSPADDDDLALGIAATEAFLARFPEHKLANEARMGLVQSRMARGRFAEAAIAADQFLSDAKRAAAPEAADVRNMLGSALLRQGKFTEAIAAWRDFLAKHPAHGAWSGVQQQLIEADYLIGAEAFRKKDYVEARKQWNEFLLRYPLDARSPRILFHFGQAEFLQEHYEAAIEEWRRLVSKYPGSEPASEAQFICGGRRLLVMANIRALPALGPASVFRQRKANVVLYLMDGYDGEPLMKKLGKHKTGRSCLYINKLADVDEGVLRAIVSKGWKAMAKKYPE